MKKEVVLEVKAMNTEAERMVRFFPPSCLVAVGFLQQKTAVGAD